MAVMTRKGVQWEEGDISALWVGEGLLNGLSQQHTVCGNSRYHWSDASDLGAHTRFLLSLLKWKQCVFKVTGQLQWWTLLPTHHESVCSFFFADNVP